MSAPAPATLLRTPLHALHLQQRAKMVAFAGYEMPLHYAAGILAEHLHTRRCAGLFDVSHMGQISVRAHPRGSAADTDNDTARALESLIGADLLGLPHGRQKYALLTNSQGGIRDDLMIQNLGGRFMLVVNAAHKQQNFDYLQHHLGDTCQLELRHDLALLALQGPRAAAVLARLGYDLADMKFMDVRELEIDGLTCTLSRSGYSGEDGFEISLAAAHAESLARRLLADADADAQVQLQLQLIGLGARDSLRLEAGLCLCGQDLTAATTPSEAALNWVISAARRRGGERAGGFPGDHIILPQIPRNIARVRVGLLPHGRAPVRPPAALLDAAGQPIGAVTSGGFSPTLGHPISMGYVQLAHAAPATEMVAVVRGKHVPLAVTKLPFVATQFFH